MTTRIPCGDYFGVRDQALLAHATQIDPDGPWFVIPREIQQKVWGTEDYELVTSHVESEIPEDDLFAGRHPRLADRAAGEGQWTHGTPVPVVAAPAARRRKLPDPVPADDDVTAGWTALMVFVCLILAVVVLGVSLAKQLRKAQAARDAGRVRRPAGRRTRPCRPSRRQS